MTYPDHVTVIHRLAAKPEPGADSLCLEAVILSERHRRLAARCLEDVAVYDYAAGARAPLRDFMVDELRAVYDLQEASRRRADAEVAEVERLVASVEGAAP